MCAVQTVFIDGHILFFLNSTRHKASTVGSKQLGVNCGITNKMNNFKNRVERQESGCRKHLLACSFVFFGRIDLLLS